MRKTPSLTSLQMRGWKIFIALPSREKLWMPIYLTVPFPEFSEWNSKLPTCEKNTDKSHFFMVN